MTPFCLRTAPPLIWGYFLHWDGFWSNKKWCRADLVSPIKIYEKRLLQPKVAWGVSTTAKLWFLWGCWPTKIIQLEHNEEQVGQRTTNFHCFRRSIRRIKRRLVGYEAPKKSHNPHVDPVMNFMDLVGDLVSWFGFLVLNWVKGLMKFGRKKWRKTFFGPWRDF